MILRRKRECTVKKERENGKNASGFFPEVKTESTWRLHPLDA